MAKSKKGLDKRRRDKSGRIDKKHGNTKVAALRKEYGARRILAKRARDAFSKHDTGA